MRPQLLVNQLVKALSKEEAKQVAQVLKTERTEQAALEYELFRVFRKRVYFDQDTLRSRLDSEKLRKYTSKYKQQLKVRMLKVLLSQSADLELKEQAELQHEVGTIRMLHSKGFTEEAISQLDKLIPAYDGLRLSGHFKTFKRKG
jgi:hypothetical protein